MLQVGAHIDGVAAGPGINDDGTGTAMNLTIAHQIMKLGINLKYKIRFGWFSGEEQGLYGSTFFVNQLNSLQTTQTLAMLDYDMIASTNWIPFMYVPNNATEPTLPQAQKDAEATLSKTHIDYLNNKLNVKQVDYPFDNRSDYAQWRRPSATRGVPATGFYTGAEGIKTAQQVADNAASTAGTGGQAGIQADPCYHEWCDTVFNLSQYGMDEFTDVLAHSILSFAGVGQDAVEMPIRTGQLEQSEYRLLAAGLRGQQPELVGPPHGLGAIAHAELAEDRRGVLLDGVGGEPQRARRSPDWWHPPRTPSARRAHARRRRPPAACRPVARPSRRRATAVRRGTRRPAARRRPAPAAAGAARRPRARPRACGRRRSPPPTRDPARRAGRPRGGRRPGRPRAPGPGAAGARNGSRPSARMPSRRAVCTAAARLGAPSLS